MNLGDRREVMKGGGISDWTRDDHRPRHEARRLSTRSSLLIALASLSLLASCSGDADSPAESADETVRLRVDGITLLWPAEFFSSVDRVPAASGGDDAALTVAFVPTEEASDGELSVVVARTPSGTETPDLSPEDRVRLAALDALADGSGSDPAGRVIEFVNGVGVRTLDGSEYRFDGLTKDGRFLLAFSTTLGEGMTDPIDEMITTIFVDGAADVYATDDCEDGIELVTENGLPDRATFAPGAEVTATWELRNTGTCTWGDDYSWVFTGGQPVTVLSAGTPADVRPGESTEVSVVFLVPEEPGQFAAQWQLQAPTDLEPLGTPAFALFVVES